MLITQGKMSDIGPAGRCVKKPSSKPTPGDLLRRYEALGDMPRAVLHAKALLGPIGISKTAFITALTKSGVFAPDGRKWQYQVVDAAMKQLSQQGLLDEQQECPAAILHQMARAAVESEAGVAIAEALKRLFPLGGYVTTSYRNMGPAAGVIIQLRIAIYLNQSEVLEEIRQQAIRSPSPDGFSAVVLWTMADQKLDAAWLATRSPPIRLALLAANFLPARLGKPKEGAEKMITDARPALADLPEAQEFYALYDILHLNVGQAASFVASLAGTPTESGLKLAGAVALLNADFNGAIAFYRQALKLLRARLGTRKIHFDDEHLVFFCFALLGTRSESNLNDLRIQLEIASQIPTPHRHGIDALQAVLWLLQGLDGKAREAIAMLARRLPGDPLSDICVFLAQHLLDGAALSTFRSIIGKHLETSRDSVPLHTRFLAEFWLLAGGAPHAVQSVLEAGDGRTKLRLGELLQAEPAWMRALASLDAQLFGKAPSAKSDTQQKAKRLVWFIDPKTQEVQPCEQVARGPTGFSDGRPVALKRFYDGDEKLDYLTDQDRAAAKAVTKEVEDYYGGHFYEIDPLRCIPALVGHPLVFDANKRSVRLDLVEGTPELVVSEKAGMFHVSLSHAAESTRLFLEAETPTRYRVIVFPKKLLPIQEVLGAGGLRVPREGRDRLLEMVRRGQPSLPIRTEIEGFGPEAISGQPAPVVQMLPQGDSVKISLVVRPFGPLGPAYVAGLGNRVVSAHIAGEPCRAARDLKRELSERQALLDACPSLRDRGGADLQEVVIDDLETQLEILLELQTVQAADPQKLSIEWPDGRRVGVRALAAQNMKLRVAQNRDWFTVDGSFSVDDGQILDMRYLLERLDRAHGRFVRLGDGSFVALTRQLQAQLGRLAAVSEPDKAGRRLHALGAPALRDILEDAGEIKQDSGWKKQIARIEAAERFEPRVPQSLQAELRDYQVEGFAWMARLAAWGAGACLADDMGLGKTVQAIAVMLTRAAEGPILVVAPTSVCANWESEIARFAPGLTAFRFAAAADRAALVEKLGPSDVLICSYGLLHLEQAALGAKTWSMAVLDEAQAIKNAASRRAQASTELQAGFRLALTGTPVENDLDELWSLFSFVNPGLLGARESFAKRFAIPIARDRDPAARAALRALVRPFLLRRTKSAVLSELPSRTEQTLLVEMGEAERVFYEAMRQRAMEKLNEPESAGPGRKIRILAEITRLRRACCNPALIDPEAGVPSAKLEALMDLVEELIANRHRALVFSQFTSHLALVRAALEQRGVDYEYLDGSTPAAEREKRVSAFQSGSKPLFLISLKAGGTGLNLTAADYVVHLDPWWNPAVEDQASDRAHRIGQERPVTIYRLIMQGSIEEKILELHRDKRDLAADILDGAEMSARLSEEALLALIKG